MGEYDDGRVEPRTMLVGTGMGVTSERLQQIEQRRRQLEKLSPAKPAEAFDTVLARRQGARIGPRPSAKEEKLRRLPRKGPRPALAHPDHSETFGREGAKEEVVLKG